MEKTYQPKAIEAALYQIWEQSGHFQPSGQGMSYSIALPPPNVTGSLHMGHGFQDTLMDCLTRYHRMSGDNTLWQPGTDHAGIATQMVVERQLAAEGKTRHDLGREAFNERVWKWKEQSGGNISQQMRRLGASADWSREKFSMDATVSKATLEAFIKLYQEGLIYRGKRLVNWDPVLQTAISDLEVLSEEEFGFMWHIRYPLSDGSGHVEIATTRPETLLGDSAVAVHPEDERYQSIIGKTAKLPLCEREIPIIADDYVEQDFGTGCVKITPAHDFNDHAVGKRHDLEMRNIFTPAAAINTNAPSAYQGLDRVEARKQIIKDLDAQGFLVKTEKHALKIPRSERSKAIVEPYLSDQWFVSVESLATPAIDAVREGRVHFVPENTANIYYRWMENIEDWCISRQLWWGHRIPAWYDDAGNVYVGHDEADVRQTHGLDAELSLRQEESVLDTWFTAALWPFSSLEWPENNKALKSFYPTSVLVTGFDIIFFWVARMIMFGLKFMGDVPFREVYVHGLIRDHEGQKMSKSKGNVLDPVDLIDGITLDALIEKRTYGMMQPHLKEKVIAATRQEFPEGIAAYGTDALRFTYCALASTSRDVCFDIKRMEGYRNFCNKLWNAARFVQMQLDKHEFDRRAAKTMHPADHWIWHLFNERISACHQAIAEYRFDQLAQNLYEMVWNDYCDWYLEFAKVTLNSTETTAAEKNGTCATLVALLEAILRLAHPVIPFITDSIWQQLKPYSGETAETIMNQPYPQASDNLENQPTYTELEWVKRVITAIRTLRSEANIAPSKTVTISIHAFNRRERNLLTRETALIQQLAKVSEIDFIDEGGTIPASSMQLIEQMEIHLPMAGNVDLAAEKERLTKTLAKLQKEIMRLEGKLNNPGFVAKAPKAVVDKERNKLEEAQNAFTQLQQQLDTIGN